MMAYLICINCRHYEYCGFRMSGREAEDCEWYDDDITSREKPKEIEEKE